MTFRPALAVLTVATLLAGAAAAQTGFDVWDRDGDQRLSREEFDAGPARLQPGYVQAGALPQDTPAVERYRLQDFDTDRDGALSRAEFERAAGEAGLGDDFEDWDANADQLIDAAEFEAGYARSGPAAAALGVDQQKRTAEAAYDFENWDANADGRIDAAEFARLRAEFAILEDLSAFDANGDGALSPAEYAAVPRRTLFEAGAAPGDRPYFRFEDWDANVDGVIDEAEYAALEARRLDEASGGLMGRLDTDGDGVASRAEYEAWANSFRRGLSRENVPSFSAFDRDRNGVIDRSEMVGLRNALSRF